MTYPEEVSDHEWDDMIQKFKIHKPCYTSQAADRLASEYDGKIYTRIMNQANKILYVLGKLSDKQLKAGDGFLSYHIVRR